MCRFSRVEFTEGFRSLKVDSIRAMQIRLPEVVSEISTRPGKKFCYLCIFRMKKINYSKEGGYFGFSFGINYKENADICQQIQPIFYS